MGRNFVQIWPPVTLESLSCGVSSRRRRSQFLATLTATPCALWTPCFRRWRRPLTRRRRRCRFHRRPLSPLSSVWKYFLVPPPISASSPYSTTTKKWVVTFMCWIFWKRYYIAMGWSVCWSVGPSVLHTHVLINGSLRTEFEWNSIRIIRIYYLNDNSDINTRGDRRKESDVWAQSDFITGQMND